jgi:formylglycine-generating enzyme required for sulfatase activity
MTGTWAMGILLAAAGQEPKVEKIQIPDTPFSFEMVTLPAGKAKGAAGEVALKPFAIAKLEVSWESWAHYFTNRKAVKVDGITRPSEPYEPPNGSMGVGMHPAISMRWHGATAYCEWVSRLTGQRFRLPTEAEWEYAARAGDAGEGPAAADEMAWHKGNSGDKTQLRGGKKPNAFGLHDMMGNVWEYCLEPMDPPGFGPVVRGGAWHTPAAGLKYAHRQPIHPDWFERDPNRPRSMWWLTDATFIGFRLVRFCDPADKAAQEAYAAKLEMGPVAMGKTSAGSQRLSGTLKNAGDRTLDEVELLVSFADAKGQPVLEDRKIRPTYTKCYPVLVHSFHGGAAAKPLAPGETRAFEVDCPMAFDIDDEPVGAVARVTALQFSK